MGKITSSAPDTCKRIVAHCITEGIEKRKRAIVHKSFADPLNFWINSHVADETKLWYIVPGYGYHKFSTLSYHSLCTWQEDDGAEVRDEDLIRAPEALAQYNAATQYNVLREDGCAGVTPEVGLRPVARFYGTALVWDSHKVNKLTTKYVRASMEPSDVLVPSYCLQHHTGNTATAVTSYLHIFTRVWTLHKTFAEGDFSNKIHCHELLDDPEEGLGCRSQIFDPGMADLSATFTRSIVDRASLAAHGVTPESSGDGLRPEQWLVEKEAFIKFSPYGWNRKRPLHPCPPGCCGPQACHSREVSLEKAKAHVDKHVLRSIGEPASNKWTKMDPACAQATLMACFFSFIKDALQLKSKVTYEELAALGQEEREHLNRAQDDQEDYKGAVMRYGKRCLMFIGASETKMLMLVWNVLGGVIMTIHYRFFKHSI